MKGSVKRSGSGWGFVFDVATIEGKRRQIRRRGFATRKAADEALADEMARARGGELVTPTRLTLGQYLMNTWLPTVERNVRPTTFDAYRRAVTKHIIGTRRSGGDRWGAVEGARCATVVRFLGVLDDRGLAAEDGLERARDLVEGAR